MYRSKASYPRDVYRLEGLEDRRMLAGTPWGQQEVTTGHDKAVANYPSITGAGTAIAGA